MGELLSRFRAYETTDATAVAADLVTGKTAYGKYGKITGGGSDPSAPGNSLKAKHQVFITDDATATAADILTGKTAFINGGLVTGTWVTGAVPVLESSSETKTDSITYTITGTIPAGTVSGDLLLAFVSSQTAWNAWTDPSGWTRYGSYADANSRITIWYKAATGSDSNPVFESNPTSKTSNGLVCHILRISGASVTTPVHQIQQTNSPVGGSHTFTGVTTTNEKCLGVIAAQQDYGDDPAFNSWTNGATEVDELWAVTGFNGMTQGIAQKDLTVAGATGSFGVTTVTSADTVLGLVLAINNDTVTLDIADASMVAYYELNEASGNRTDIHGSITMVDNNTVTSATGIQGNAALFTAANLEYLNAGAGTALRPRDQDWCCWGWVYGNTLPATFPTIFSAATSGAVGYSLLYNHSSARFEFYVNSGVANYYAQASTFGAPSATTWYFIYAEYNDATNTIGISINDGTKDTASGPGASINTADYNVLFGAHWSVGRYWDGRIDEFGVSNRLLTADEITFLYNSGSGRTYSEL